METFWFIALSCMLITYAVLDGFDLGAGVLHLVEAKTEEERKTVLNVIGPLWDGNEVWLIAFGGTLYFAFPHVYASAFSGLYLPLMMVLWMLMFRALGIELRRHFSDHMWITFWDFAFSAASLGLTIVFGAGLGIIVRGVPLDENGWFFLPFWTDFVPANKTGVLDWMSLLYSLAATTVLCGHGALFVAYKTHGQLSDRSRRVARRAWMLAALFVLGAWGVTYSARPELFQKVLNGGLSAVVSVALAVLVVGAWMGLWVSMGRRADLAAFLFSCLFITVCGLGIAYAQYPDLLHADGGRSLTAQTSATSPLAMEIGLVWFGVGITLVIGWFVYLYYTFRGKIADQSRHHY